MFGWIEPFFEPCEAAVDPGHVWTDQPIYLPPRHGLTIERVDPNDDRRLNFTIGGRTAEIFNHPPVHSLKLESTEGAVVAKTKRDRPVIILGGTSSSELSAGGDRAHLADTVMVVPVYGADQFSEHMRRRIAYYEFTNLYYLPANREPRLEEGFARLDHVQPVSRNHLGRHRGLKLSADALDALIEWFIACATGRQPTDSILLEYRREMLSQEG